MKAMFPPARMLSLTIIPDNAGANVGNGAQAGSEGRRLVGIASAFILAGPLCPLCAFVRGDPRKRKVNTFDQILQ